MGALSGIRFEIPRSHVTNLDDRLEVRGIAPEKGEAYLELRALHRPVSSVSPDDFQPSGAAVRVPIHLSGVLAEELIGAQRRLAQALSEREKVSGDTSGD